jgi:predicted dehydrogenase
VADLLTNAPGSGLRLGLVGAGGIAEFHVPALRAAGFEVAAVCARPGSTRARDFANRHGIAQVLPDTSSMLAARDRWDALVIAIPIEDTLAVLLEAVATGAPVLVEKPVAYRASDLAPLLGRPLPVQVAYNRRFYRTVAAARDEVRNGPPVMATLTLPESVGMEGADGMLHFFSNSVHGLDMIRFVFGDVTVTAVKRLSDERGRPCGLAALLQSPRGDVVQFIGNWGAPANFALTIDRPGRRLELRPLEAAAVFTDMQVVEPTIEVPIRTYRPVQSDRVDLDAVDARLKPGFFAQAEAFARLCQGEDPAPAARLEDAHAALVLAEALAGPMPL